MKKKQVRILYDHQVFSLQNYGGITAYYEWLIPRLKKLGIESKLSLLISSNYQISKIKKHLFLNIKDRLVKRYLKYIYFLINSVYTAILMRFYNYDIYHATYYEPSFLNFLGKKKLVITIYDCAYEEMGYLQKWTKRILDNRRRLIDRSDCIIAISNEVKKDILKYYQVNPEKIKVTYLFSPLGNKIVKRRTKIKSSDKYILYVGTREFNKNFTKFIHAFKELNDKYEDIRLLCLGGGKFTDNEIGLFDELNITNKTEWKNIVTDKDTIKYLQRALMFVYPSLKEGFGIPLLNAFACGCPVVASDIPVFREVAGGAFVPFNPKSVGSMLKSFVFVLSNTNQVDKYVRYGYKILRRYSPDRMAKETAAIYREILK